MKIKVLLAGFLTILINNPVYACDIVNKRNVHMDGLQGVAGNCSNNGEKIECFDIGEYSGGIRCHGPVGDNTAYNLNQLIDAVCGCTHEDVDSIDEQIKRERMK